MTRRLKYSAHTRVLNQLSEFLFPLSKFRHRAFECCSVELDCACPIVCIVKIF